jgi:hypothetical protein
MIVKKFSLNCMLGTNNDIFKSTVIKSLDELRSVLSVLISRTNSSIVITNSVSLKLAVTSYSMHKNASATPDI